MKQGHMVEGRSEGKSRRGFRRSRGWAAALCVLLILTGLFTGCEQAGGGVKGKALVFGCSKIEKTDPVLSQQSELASLIFSGLIRRDSDGALVGDLADSWEFSQTDNVYTFHLKEDVKWHDGKAFTAEDVRFTLETITDPVNDSPLASRFEDVDGVDVVDDHTVRIAVAAPNAAFLNDLTVGMLPEHSLRGKDLTSSEFNWDPVGTGPFQIEDWRDGESITLVRNDRYYGKEPKLERMIFQMTDDSRSKLERLKSGELSVTQITPSEAMELGEMDGYTVTAMKTADYRSVLYQLGSDLFLQNPELPAALSYAVDRQAMVNDVLLGYGTPAYSPLQMSDYNNPRMERYEYDPAKARQLLETAGWEEGADGIYEKDGTPLAFTLYCLKADPVSCALAERYAEQMAAIGVRVSVEPVAYLDWASQDAYACLTAGGDPFDPDNASYQVFGTNKSGNRGNYSNDRVDALLSEAKELESPDQRRPLYQEFQDVLAENPPLTFLVYVDALYVVKDGVSGLDPQQLLGRYGQGIFQNISRWDVAASKNS